MPRWRVGIRRGPALLRVPTWAARPAPANVGCTAAQAAKGLRAREMDARAVGLSCTLWMSALS